MGLECLSLSISLGSHSYNVYAFFSWETLFMRILRTTKHIDVVFVCIVS